MGIKLKAVFQRNKKKDGKTSEGAQPDEADALRHDNSDDADVVKNGATTLTSSAHPTDSHGSTSADNQLITVPSMMSRTAGHEESQSQATDDSGGCTGGRRMGMRKSRRALRDESKRQLDQSMIATSGPSGTRMRQSRRCLMAFDDASRADGGSKEHAGLDPDDMEGDLGVVIQIPFHIDHPTINSLHAQNNQQGETVPGSASSPAGSPSNEPGTVEGRSRSRSSGRRSSQSGDRPRTQPQRAPSQDGPRRSRSRTGRKSRDAGDSGQVIPATPSLDVQPAEADSPSTTTGDLEGQENKMAVLKETNRDGVLEQPGQTPIESKPALGTALGGTSMDKDPPEAANESTSDEGTANNQEGSKDGPTAVQTCEPNSKTEPETRDRSSGRLSGTKDRVATRSGSRERRPPRSSSRDGRTNSSRSSSRDPPARPINKNRSSSRDRGQRSRSSDRRSARRSSCSELSAESQHGIQALFGGDLQGTAGRRPSLDETVVVANTEVENEARRTVLDEFRKLPSDVHSITSSAEGNPIDDTHIEALSGIDASPDTARRTPISGKDGSTILSASREHRMKRRSSRGEKDLRSSNHSVCSGQSLGSRSSHHISRRDAAVEKGARRRSSHRSKSNDSKSTAPEESPVNSVDPKNEKQVQSVAVVFRDEDGNIATHNVGNEERSVDVPQNNEPTKEEFNAAAALLRHLENDECLDSGIPNKAKSSEGFEGQRIVQSWTIKEDGDSSTAKKGTSEDPPQSSLGARIGTSKNGASAPSSSYSSSDLDPKHSEEAKISDKERRRAARKARREKENNEASTNTSTLSNESNMAALLGLIGSTEEDFKTKDTHLVSGVFDDKPKSSVDFFQSLSAHTSMTTAKSQSKTQSRSQDAERGVMRSKSFDDAIDVPHTSERSSRKKNARSSRNVLSQSDQTPRGISSIDEAGSTATAVDGTTRRMSKKIQRTVSEEDDDDAHSLPPPSLAGDVPISRKPSKSEKIHPICEGNESTENDASEQEKKKKREGMMRSMKKASSALSVVGKRSKGVAQKASSARNLLEQATTKAFSRGREEGKGLLKCISDDDGDDDY
jgi:hypothetical protein